MRWFRRLIADRTARRLPRHAVGPAVPGQRDYVVTANLGGFGHIDFRWPGRSREDVRDAFLEYLNNDAEFADGLRFARYRSMHVRFNGRHMLLTFRTDWVAGFTVR